jgi:flavin-dependent dehydrogenase
MEPEYDVVIAGGGPAGCIAGTVAARGGLRVLVVDRNPQPSVGKKTTWGWTCGDAVGKHHLDFVKKELDLEYGSPEIENAVEEIEQEVYRQGKQEVPSSIIGEMVMEHLRKMDKIAYIRFASVYRSFGDVETMFEEIKSLMNREKGE